jgi:hypothetical protein
VSKAHLPTPKECMDGREVINQCRRDPRLKIKGGNGSSHVPIEYIPTGESITLVNHETGIGLACKWAKTLAKWGVLFSTLVIAGYIWNNCPDSLYVLYQMFGG